MSYQLITQTYNHLLIYRFNALKHRVNLYDRCSTFIQLERRTAKWAVV